MTDQGTTWRERQWQLRDEAIVDAAQRLLDKHGYSTMSMDELAAEVGISKATLYQHVSSKEEVAARAIVKSVRQMNDFIAALDGTRSALERLKAAINFFVERRYKDGAPAPATSKSLHTILLDHAEFQRQHTTLMTRLEQLVVQAQSEGSLIADLPSALLVRVMLSCTRDSEYEALISAGRCTSEELRHTLMTFIFHGVSV